MSSSPVTSELIAQIRTCFTNYITDLEREMDAIGDSSSAEYRSHDEMKAADDHWDELDYKIMRIQTFMSSLDAIPAAAAEISDEEILSRIDKIKNIVNVLMVTPYPQILGEDGAEEEEKEDEPPARRYDADGYDMDANYGACGYICEGDCYDCRWRAESYYGCGDRFDLADEI
jgi:hypothetical protein